MGHFPVRGHRSRWRAPCALVWGPGGVLVNLNPPSRLPHGHRHRRLRFSSARLLLGCRQARRPDAASLQSQKPCPWTGFCISAGLSHRPATCCAPGSRSPAHPGLAGSSCASRPQSPPLAGRPVGEILPSPDSQTGHRHAARRPDPFNVQQGRSGEPRQAWGGTAPATTASRRSPGAALRARP